MKNVIKVGMLGIGNVGTGTYRALEMNRNKIRTTTGFDIDIVRILARNPDKDRGIDISKPVVVLILLRFISSAR